MPCCSTSSFISVFITVGLVFNHEVLELLRLGKSSKIIESNLSAALPVVSVGVTPGKSALCRIFRKNFFMGRVVRWSPHPWSVQGHWPV